MDNTTYPEKIASHRIVNFWTLGSKYDNDSLAVRDDKGRYYRIKAKTLLQSLDVAYPVFTVKKARVYHYLTI